MIEVGRRGFFLGLASLFAAPAIVRATSLMLVRAAPLIIAPEPEILRGLTQFQIGTDVLISRLDFIYGAVLPRGEWGMIVPDEHGDAFYRRDHRVITHAL